MEHLKDVVTIAAIIFTAGGAWSLVKFLKEAVGELKVNDAKLTEMLVGHETRISVLEDRTRRKK